MCNNPLYRLIRNNRSRIRSSFKSNIKATNSIDLLGCNKEFFYKWIQFQLPYSIDDSEFREYFHIDHCMPLATFNLVDPQNQYDAFSWQNCQPLLKSKNLSKGAKRNL